MKNISQRGGIGTSREVGARLIRDLLGLDVPLFYLLEYVWEP